MPRNACSIGWYRLKTPVSSDCASIKCVQYQSKPRLNACQLRTLSGLKLRLHGLNLLLKLSQLAGHDTPLPFRLNTWRRHFYLHIDPFEIRSSRFLASRSHRLHLKPKVICING